MAGDQVVPAGPDPAPLGKDAGVGVKYRVVFLVSDGSQDLFFNMSGVCEHGKGLIGVDGRNNVVKGRFCAAEVGDLHPVGEARHAGHWCGDADAVFKTADDFIDIAPGSSPNDPPLQGMADIEKSVVFENRTNVSKGNASNRRGSADQRDAPRGTTNQSMNRVENPRLLR